MKLNSPAKRLGFVLLIVAFVAFIFVSLDQKAKENTAPLRITITDYETKKFIKKEEIQQQLNDTFPATLNGVTIGSIDIKRIEDIVKRNDFVEEAEVYIDATNHVNIKLSQREPIVRVVDMEGSNYYIDTKGRYMPTSRHFTARVPVASGFVTNRMYNIPIENIKNPLNSLFILVKYIQSDDFLNAQIEQIYVEKSGDFVLVPKIGAKIILGNAADLPEKFKRLKIFYKEASSYTGFTKYKSINVKFKGQVVCEK
ncbi:MAG: hypothetical protein RI894_2094 [Bacteroidota bacterium]